MKSKKKIFVLTIFPLFFGVFNYLPAKATSNDAITLESISAVSTTVLTGQNIVMQLEVAVPTGYDWDPNVSALGGKISVLYCPSNRYTELLGIGSCSFSGTSSNLYTLSTIGSVTNRISGLFNIKTFQISGSLNSGEINNFKLFRIRIPAANLPDRTELHTYLRGQIYAQELGSNRTDIIVPSFLNGDISVVSSLPTPTPSPTPTSTVSVTPTPSPTPTVTETATPTPTPTPTSTVSVTSTPSPTPTPTVSVTPTPSPTPTVTETATPTPTPTPSDTETATPTPTPSVSETIPVSITITTSNSSRSESSNSSRTIAEVSIPLAIQSAGKAILQTPSRNGDLTWKKAEDIYVKNINWETKINKNANNGNFIQTNSNESPIVIFTSGDAFTLRFLTGKTRGNIQINVDGKKLANFKTSAKKSSFKAKSWIGIGPGKHKIEIIPILKSGESIGLDAIHVARAV